MPQVALLQRSSILQLTVRALKARAMAARARPALSY